MPAAPLLQVENLTKSFGGIRAVDRCTLSVGVQEVVGLIGPNGAGKSTLFSLIMGLYAPEAGRIVLRGQGIDGLPPYEVVRRGIAKTFKVPREFQAMTVLENVLVCAVARYGETLGLSLLGSERVWKEEDRLRGRASEILDLVTLGHLSDELARNLSGGQKKLLELARALMVNPQLLLLDEPVAGVNPVLSAKLLSVIQELRSTGKTFFLIEHDMDVVFRNCDRVIVMHQGRVIAEGTPQEIRGNDAVRESYLGG